MKENPKPGYSRNLFFLTIALASAALIYLAYKVGGKIAFEKQWPLYEALRSTASIIFAVVGAWLAIIYPDRLKLSFGEKQDSEASKKSPARLKVLFIPAVHSTIILVILLIFGVIAPIAKEITFFSENIELSRKLSFILLTVLTIYQAVIVVLAILPAGFLAHAAEKEIVQEKQNSIFRRARDRARADKNV